MPQRFASDAGGRLEIQPTGILPFHSIQKSEARQLSESAGFSVPRKYACLHRHGDMDVGPQDHLDQI